MNVDVPAFSQALQTHLQSITTEWEWACDSIKKETADLLTPAKVHVAAKNRLNGIQTLPIYVTPGPSDPQRIQQTAKFILQVLMIRPQGSSMPEPVLLFGGKT
jgi:hypothetical protein